ncbi:MAG: helix-turn-helix domain-containing protein [Candidatus Omnitrophica bacterium]|nr:helix-turn-helix domain-containing protein [Candidatus Omnitrophota bacterium]
MATGYKLNNKIINFILRQKQRNPSLSCRKLAALIKEKLNISLSKSQINNFLKSKGLSMPIGRRLKKIKLKRRLTAIYLLKLIDNLLGLTSTLTKNLKVKIKRKDLYLLNQALIFSSFFNNFKPDSYLWPVLGERLSENYILSYLKELEGVDEIKSILKNTLYDLFNEVLAVKFSFSDGSFFYLDAQLHSLWSTEHIPYDFAITYYKLKSYIKNILKNDSPRLILFTAPGYEIIPLLWFNFLIRFNQIYRYRLLQLTFLDSDFKKIEVIPINNDVNLDIVFAMWPWQYEKCRLLEDIKEEGVLELLEKKFYVSSAKIKLLQPTINQSVILNGLILKKEPQGKTEVFILTTNNQPSLSTVINYLKKWPTLQEGFKNYAKKIELFTYHPLAKKNFPKEEIYKLLENNNLSIKDIYEIYLKSLDLYLRWYFLPLEYREADFKALKERIYNLPLSIKTKKDRVEFILHLPSEYPYREDFNYLAKRLVEGNLFFGKNSFSLRIQKENVF